MRRRDLVRLGVSAAASSLLTRRLVAGIRAPSYLVPMDEAQSDHL